MHLYRVIKCRWPFKKLVFIQDTTKYAYFPFLHLNRFLSNELNLKFTFDSIRFQDVLFCNTGMTSLSIFQGKLDLHLALAVYFGSSITHVLYSFTTKRVQSNVAVPYQQFRTSYSILFH